MNLDLTHVVLKAIYQMNKRKKRIRTVVFALSLTLVLLCRPTYAGQMADGNSPKEIARKILQVTGVKGGLVVHTGCDSGELTASLYVNEGFLVHGLDTDVSDIENARKHIQSKGLYGRVSVELWSGESLPYINNLVELIVVEKQGDPKEDEMMRVLAPGGVACIKSDGRWITKTKPVPNDIDEWTHYLHGPDNNAVANDSRVGPPRNMQWIGGPRWTRHHDWLNSISSAVTASGRLFYIVDKATAANLNVPSEWVIVARSAFNGVTLWEKEMKSWIDHKKRFRSGPQQATRLLVASKDKLYTPLSIDGPIVVLDAASGKTVDTFTRTSGAEEIILTGGTLLVLKGEPAPEQAFSYPQIKKKFQFPNRKSLIAVNAKTGDVLWEWSSEKQPVPETLASDGKNAYMCIAGGGAICLDLQSGRERWYYGPEAGSTKRSVSYGKRTLVTTRGVVVFNMGDELIALSAEKGKKLWSCQAGTSFHAPLDVFVIDGLVWQKVAHEMDPMRVPPDMREARDLFTGELKVKDLVALNLLTPGHHFRCYRAKATERFILAGKRGIEMMAADGGAHSRNNWVRGTCQYGILPANGLIYVPPNSCGCFTEALLHGFWALAPEQAAINKSRADNNKRLEKGTAYGKVESSEPNESQSWPTYRGDSQRRGIASTKVPAELEREWQNSLGSKLTQPVVSGDYVVAADVDSGIVYAVRRKNGKVIWQHVAGGRVDSPPTIYKGQVLFGSADGSVTSLRLSDGETVWRFLAAPSDLRSVAFNRIESVWPVRGSVLVLEGIAYFSAGRSTWLDGGIHLYGLDTETGDVRHHKHMQNQHPQYAESEEINAVHLKGHLWTDYKTFSQPDQSDSFSTTGSVSDVLVSDGNNVFMRHLMFNRKLEKIVGPSRQLFSTFSLLDDSEHHRLDWGLGLGDYDRLPASRHKGGYSRAHLEERSGEAPYVSDNPTGVMLVFDETDVWGVQRSNRRRFNGEYKLFKKKIASPKNQYVWARKIRERPRALLKSGDNLFVATMPIDVPVDDLHAAYEGRLGGSIRVYDSETGDNEIARYSLESPVVWDGLAAADGRLYFSTEDGGMSCFSEP